jgi:hypothetical protein
VSESYSRVREGKRLSDILTIKSGLKQVNALLPLLFNFGLQHVIRSVQVNQGGLKSFIFQFANQEYKN